MPLVTVMLNPAAISALALSVSVTLTLIPEKVPATVGVPVIAPVDEFIDSPVGSEPAKIE